MEWMTSLKAAIDFMEQHLLEDIDAQDVARTVHMSPYYFQNGFKLVTGYSVKEYIRCRRLYLAALEVVRGKEKIIDLSYRYGYDTPESFSKAFSRFHGVSPLQLQGDSKRIRPFLPLKITATVQGGNNMDYIIEKMDAFQVIGISARFSFQDSYAKIPEFWNLHWQHCQDGTYTAEVLNMLRDCHVGEFAINIDDGAADGSFLYLIAGTYNGGPVPDGLEIHTLPAATWAKFRCTGPMPGALQAVNTQIFQQWLPGNRDYEIAGRYNIEWYSSANTQAQDYESAIWIPLKEK